MLQSTEVIRRIDFQHDYLSDMEFNSTFLFLFFEYLIDVVNMVHGQTTLFPLFLLFFEVERINEMRG